MRQSPPPHAPKLHWPLFSRRLNDRWCVKTNFFLSLSRDLDSHRLAQIHTCAGRRQTQVIIPSCFEFAIRYAAQASHDVNREAKTERTRGEKEKDGEFSSLLLFSSPHPRQNLERRARHLFCLVVGGLEWVRGGRRKS